LNNRIYKTKFSRLVSFLFTFLISHITLNFFLIFKTFLYLSL